MAYGQTGAGKTFTMDGNEKQPGLIPLAIERLFRKAAQGEVQISISMLEVYQEQLRDLLGSHRLTLRNIGGEGGPEVRELRIEHAKNREEALSIYETGARLRHLGMSERNSRSSRSHLVLSFYVRRLDPTKGEVVSTSKISLVDLAGSERQSSGTAFDRSRVNEASVINNSLTSLSKVVQACVTRAASPRPDRGIGCHIPYRDSVLTQLLSDSIGGQGKTLVIVHVTQREEDVQESLRTLLFASNAACVQERPVARSEEERVRRQLGKVTAENQRLKDELSAIASFPTHSLPSARRCNSPKSPRVLDREGIRRESRDELHVRSSTASSAVSSPRPGAASQALSGPSCTAGMLHSKLAQYSRSPAQKTTATHGGG
jgi:kinesin family protein C2/C3